MADYQKRKDEAMQEAEQQNSAYAEQRKQANTQYIDATNAAYDNSGKAYSEKIQSEIGALPQKYRPQYDANAVQELVNRRQVAEAMANYGLTDSGLNRSQQTAISLQRGNADYGTRQQQAEEQRTMEQAIRDYLANVEFQKASAAAQANLQAHNDIMNNYNSLFASGLQNAASLYGADLEAEAAAAKLAEQQRQFNAEQELKEKQATQSSALTTASLLSEAGASEDVIIRFLQDAGVIKTGSRGTTSSAASAAGNAAVNSIESVGSTALQAAQSAIGNTAQNAESTIRLSTDAVKNSIRAYIANVRPQGEDRTNYIKKQIESLYNSGAIDLNTVKEVSDYFGVASSTYDNKPAATSSATSKWTSDRAKTYISGRLSYANPANRSQFIKDVIREMRDNNDINADVERELYRYYNV